MRPWLLVAGAAYAALGATFTSHGIPALVAVLVPGVAVLVAVAVSRRPRAEPAGVTAGRLAWLVWAVCFAAWETLALLLGELSFSLLMDRCWRSIRCAWPAGRFGCPPAGCWSGGERMLSWLLGTGFVLLALAALAVEVAARRTARLTVGDLLAAATATRTTRLVMAVLWLWVGWHFLAR